MSKHERIRVEQWSKVLCQVTNNIVWKKNRNLYTLMLIDQILGEKLEKPFNSQPPDGGLPLLSKTQVMSSLTNRVKDLRMEVDSNSIKQKLINTNDNNYNERPQSIDRPRQINTTQYSQNNSNQKQNPSNAMYRTQSQQSFQSHNTSSVLQRGSFSGSNQKSQRNSNQNNGLPPKNKISQFHAEGIQTIQNQQQFQMAQNTTREGSHSKNNQNQEKELSYGNINI
eukprot:403362653